MAEISCAALLTNPVKLHSDVILFSFFIITISNALVVYLCLK